LSYAPTVGILAGRTNENYSIRRRFLAGGQQRRWSFLFSRASETLACNATAEKKQEPSKWCAVRPKDFEREFGADILRC